MAKSMRQLLIDVLRSKSSIKRKHFATDQSFTQIIGDDDVNIKFFDIERALVNIEKINPIFCEVLEYKLIFNFTFVEIAETINKSERQVKRIWKQAKALLIALTKNSPKACE
jgi:DNA-directed RNA polymerase specialized sigma24 family protein